MNVEPGYSGSLMTALELVAGVGGLVVAVGVLHRARPGTGGRRTSRCRRPRPGGITLGPWLTTVERATEVSSDCLRGQVAPDDRGLLGGAGGVALEDQGRVGSGGDVTGGPHDLVGRDRVVARAAGVEERAAARCGDGHRRPADGGAGLVAEQDPRRVVVAGLDPALGADEGVLDGESVGVPLGGGAAGRCGGRRAGGRGLGGKEGRESGGEAGGEHGGDRDARQPPGVQGRHGHPRESRSAAPWV